MINNFEVIIGIEVHTSLNTKTKMFSPSKNSHNDKPNTNVNEIDLGLPGTLPTVNKAAVYKAIWLADELNMQTNYQNICFDRKNYFYIDLPKGFQITQQYNPIATNGYIELDDHNKIEIERFHLEEDTAKQIIKDNFVFLDYNRCGCPLIEIVTKPVIRSSLQAAEYLNKLIIILKFLNISDAKLEEGSLRADINISLRPFGSNEFGSKVEIKNINSVSNVIKAIDFEIKRQAELLLSNQKIEQETRRFDDTLNQTVFMRKKSNTVDYRYIFEPNILNIKLSDSEFKEILKQKPCSIKQIVSDLLNNGLNNEMVQILLNNFELYTLFNKIVSQVNDYLLVYKWLSVELLGIAYKNNDTLKDFSLQKTNELIKMFNLLIKQEINGKQSKVILEQIYFTNKSVETIIKENNMEQIKDPEIIKSILLKHINNNLDMCQNYNQRPERVEKFLIGMLMKDTNAQANPVISNKVLLELLQKFK